MKLRKRVLNKIKMKKIPKKGKIRKIKEKIN